MTKDEMIRKFLIDEKRRIENILANVGYLDVTSEPSDRDQYMTRIRDDLYVSFNTLEAMLECPFD